MIAFTREQENFRRSVARFVDAEVAPAAQAMDEQAEFPTALFRRIGELGYFGLRYPEAYGGSSSDMVTYCLFAEELALFAERSFAQWEDNVGLDSLAARRFYEDGRREHIE